MIEVLLGVLHEQETEGIVRPICSDLVPVTAASRDFAEGAGEAMTDKLERIGSIPLVLGVSGALVLTILATWVPLVAGARRIRSIDF